MAINKEQKVGIYVRLSNEDARAGESVSIENQKLMLTKHVKEMGWELVEIYQDDGFSGTNQNRPGLQRMIHDVKQKRINIVLIKDLSRLGRNYLDVGNLAEVTLPEYGCELVSLNEKIDDMMFIRNWFNEQHSKETSKKVKAVKKIFAESGKYMGTYAPYGYRKDPDNKHRLLIDENTAPVVRKMFEMKVQGKSFRSIAITLNESGIMPPRDYYYEGKNRDNPLKVNHHWSDQTLKVMLRNEVYIGNIVQGKVGTVSYKDHRCKKKDNADWIRAEGMHEPLISMELWERVQAIDDKKYKPRTKSNGTTSIFTGLCVCADCNFNMKNNNQRKKRKDGTISEYSSFICGNYSRSGKSACTVHGISETALHQIVAAQIRRHAQLVKCNEKRVVSEMLRHQNTEAIQTQKTYQSEINAHNKRVGKLNVFIEKLYEDRVNQIVPEDFFRRQHEKYEQERTERLQTIETLQKRLSEIKLKTDNTETWVRLIRRYTELETLNSEILLLLVDKIIVGETEIVDGKRVCDVRISYNYVGNALQKGRVGGAYAEVI